MIKGCAFDVGNTLINDTKLVQDALEDTANWLEQRGIIKQKEPFITIYNKINKSTFRPFISHTFGEEEFFQKTFEKLGVENISFKQVLEKYRWFLMNRTSLDKGVIETFKFLQRKGIRVALLTNERVKRVEALLRKTELVNLLDAVVVSEQVQIEKPDPAIFMEVSKRLRVKYKEMVMFGDNEIADGGAKQVGMKFVLVTAYKNSEWQWERGLPIQPDYIIKKVERKEVERCLEALSKICKM